MRAAPAAPCRAPEAHTALCPHRSMRSMAMVCRAKCGPLRPGAQARAPTAQGGARHGRGVQGIRGPCGNLAPRRKRARRAVRGMAVTDVVPLDALLRALAADAPPVAARLQALLAPSVLPGREAGPACLAQLLRAAPAAGRAFCAALASGPGAEVGYKMYQGIDAVPASIVRCVVGHPAYYQKVMQLQPVARRARSACARLHRAGGQPERGADRTARARRADAPQEQLAELIAALRDHLLASAPQQGRPCGAPPAAPAGGGGGGAGGRARGWLRGRAAAAAPDPPEANAQVRRGAGQAEENGLSRVVFLQMTLARGVLLVSRAALLRQPSPTAAAWCPAAMRSTGRAAVPQASAETPEAWAAILGGLAELCAALEPGQAPPPFAPGQLAALAAAAPAGTPRADALRLAAAALPGLPADAALQDWCACLSDNMSISQSTVYKAALSAWSSSGRFYNRCRGRSLLVTECVSEDCGAACAAAVA